MDRSGPGAPLVTFRSPPESLHAGAACSTLSGRGRFLPCGSLPLRRLSGSRQPLARGAASPPVDASSALDALSRLFSAHCPPVLFQTGPAPGVLTFRVMLVRLEALSGATTLLRLHHEWQVPPGSRRSVAKAMLRDVRDRFEERNPAPSCPLQGRYRAGLPAVRRGLFTRGRSPRPSWSFPPWGSCPGCRWTARSTSSRDLRDWKSRDLQSICRQPEGSTR